MTPLVHLASRIFNRPHLVAEEKLVVILGALSERFGVDVSGIDRAEMNRFVGRPSEKGDYRITKEGIAIVPVMGTLVNRGAYTGASSGLTSYEGIVKQLKDADKESGVRGILLDMDTPGGEAGGAFELPALIRDIGKRKPVWAYVNDMAASAGYLLASSASEIWTTRTGILGSIGVVMVHYDHGERLANEGIKPTVLSAGKRKAEVTPFGPMPKEARARLQAELDGMREMFIAEVVKGRPKLSAEDVRATEAGVFMGQSAVEIGLADGVDSFDRVLEVMRDRMSKLPATPSGYSTKAATADLQETTMPNDTPAGPDTTALAAAEARGRAEGAQAGIAAERARIKAILASDEAQGRTELAVALATESDMAPEAARASLAKAHKATDAGKAQPGKAFYEAVAASGGNPRVASEDHSGAPAAKSRFITDSESRFKSAAGR